MTERTLGDVVFTAGREPRASLRWCTGADCTRPAQSPRGPFAGGLGIERTVGFRRLHMRDAPHRDSGLSSAHQNPQLSVSSCVSGTARIAALSPDAGECLQANEPVRAFSGFPPPSILPGWTGSILADFHPEVVGTPFPDTGTLSGGAWCGAGTPFHHGGVSHGVQPLSVRLGSARFLCASCQPQCGLFFIYLVIGVLFNQFKMILEVDCCMIYL